MPTKETTAMDLAMDQPTADTQTQESDAKVVRSLSDLPLKWTTKTSGTTTDHTSSPQQEENVQFEFASMLGRDICSAADDILLWSSTSTRMMGRFHYRRSESMDGEKSQMMKVALSKKSCLSDRRRLRRVSSADTTVPVRGGKWWSLLRFGLLKPQLNMEMKDIRNRQKRRMGVPAKPLGTAAREEANKGQWKLLRALSCKGNEAIVVG